MRGLLLKDWYTLLKQMKLILLILVVFACIPGYSLPTFAIFYASMLPVTALAYDERSKWDELAVMLPYSVRDIVLSKYVLGLISVGAAAVVAAAALTVSGIIKGGFDYAELMGLLLIACLSLLLLSLNLPLMFRYGVEKGRIAFMALICAGMVSAMALRDTMISKINALGNITVPLVGLLVFSVLVAVLTVPLSVRLYKKRKT